MDRSTGDRSTGLGPIRRVAAPAISFAQDEGLVARLCELYPDCKVNSEGLTHYRSEDETIAYLRGYEAAIVSFEPVTDYVLENLPDLRLVAKLGVGLDRIDPHAMKRHGVRLAWTAGVNKTSVAELALCGALMALRHVLPRNLAMRAGERPLQVMGRQLSGRVVGVHGVGQIGEEFIRLLQPFGCEILGNDIKDRGEVYRRYGVKAVSVDELWDRSQVLSIHLQVTEKTRWMYSADILDRLRPDCVLVNTARGRLVDETALMERLANGRLAAAAFDAFETEPPENDTLLRLPNFVATPPIGAGSEEARWRMGITAIDGIQGGFIPEPGEFPFEDR